MIVGNRVNSQAKVGECKSMACKASATEDKASATEDGRQKSPKHRRLLHKD